MATVKKTFAIPDYGQSRIDPDTGMAESYVPMSASLGNLLAFGGSGKPVKNEQHQVTTPFARDDMIARRDSIPGLSKDYLNALKGKEMTGYTIADALAAIPQQQGAGSWLTDFARAFGSAWKSPVDNMVARGKAAYDVGTKDIENILKYDKEMGGRVDTDMGYMYPESNNDMALAMALLLGNQ